MSLLLALILQVGPFVSSQQRPASPLPSEIVNRKPRESAATTTALKGSGDNQRLRECLSAVATAPASALTAIEAWRGKARGAELAGPNHCLGAAYVGLARWDSAESAFIAARDALPESDGAGRAAYGAMAGNAALVSGANERALGLLDAALAGAGKDLRLLAGIENDRARALVALHREGEASQALASARSADPANAESWLLSATLSRRQGDLAVAQQQIEQAVLLDPLDPATGLEAGVIAVLGGRDDAARKSWQSVIGAAPDSAEAETAQGYLDQLALAPEAEGATTAP